MQTLGWLASQVGHNCCPSRAKVAGGRGGGKSQLSAEECSTSGHILSWGQLGTLAQIPTPGDQCGRDMGSNRKQTPFPPLFHMYQPALVF